MPKHTDNPAPAALAAAAGVPRLDEYFGAWAIDASRGLAMLDRVKSMNLAAHIEAAATPTPSAGLRGFRQVAVSGGAQPGEEADYIAVIPIVGTLMKQQSSLDASTSYVMLRKTIREARSNPSCKGAIFHMDSPGGSVAGCAETVAEVEAFAAEKPCIAFVSDLCASAAYRLASMATEIYANTGEALVGSIGTIVCIYDYSGACEKDGIQAKVYASGDLKGAGTPGTKITPEQDAYFQGIVTDTQKYFAADVMKGREMSAEDLAKVATGAVFLADAAAGSGLIDGIKTFDQCLARMSELIAGAGTAPAADVPAELSEEVRMPNANQAPATTGTETAAPASAADGKKFVEAFGQQGAVWFVEGKSFEEASALHNKQVAEKLEALTKENTELKAKLTDLEARNKDLRGAEVPASASLPVDPAAKGSNKDVNALENKIGKNLAAVARSIVLPKA